MRTATLRGPRVQMVFLGIQQRTRPFVTRAERIHVLEVAKRQAKATCNRLATIRDDAPPTTAELYFNYQASLPEKPELVRNLAIGVDDYEREVLERTDEIERVDGDHWRPRLKRPRPG